MAKFQFKLEKLLDYRRQLEDDAKASYLSARASRLEGEQEIEKIQKTRLEAVRKEASGLDGRATLEAYLTRLDDEQRAAESLVSVLTGEEGTAMAEWLRRRQDSEAIAKLKANQEAEWQAGQNRIEQTMLDDWTSSRRAA